MRVYNKRQPTNIRGTFVPLFIAERTMRTGDALPLFGIGILLGIRKEYSGIMKLLVRADAFTVWFPPQISILWCNNKAHQNVIAISSMRTGSGTHISDIWQLSSRMPRQARIWLEGPVRMGVLYKYFHGTPILVQVLGYSYYRNKQNQKQNLKIKIMKKATFVLAALFAAKAFTTKLNFVNATAKRLGIKKADALAMADSIEAETEDAIEPAAFKARFVEVATNFVKDALLNRIVAPTHKAAVAEVVEAVKVEETKEERAARLARNRASKKSKANAKAKKLEVVA